MTVTHCGDSFMLLKSEFTRKVNTSSRWFFRFPLFDANLRLRFFDDELWLRTQESQQQRGFDRGEHATNMKIRELRILNNQRTHVVATELLGHLCQR